MSLPFGLDLKSIIVGMLIVWFVVPYVMAFMNRGKSSAQ